ncbi:MAG: hypothetical protein M5U09_20800 [Gammaproteobacteria bacterium]|nr:hypothetical protein [Gammaproteobacteria bacterium]
MPPALLWRLYLHGVDVSERFGRVAEMWARKTPVENGYYAFNDLHAVIAFAGSGRTDAAREVLTEVEAAASGNPELTRMMARDIGIPTCTAAIAFAEGRYGEAVAQLMPVRSIANRFGGSNAQRDILTQTLLEAAIRAGERGVASNVLNERSVHRPMSPMTRRYRGKLYQY